MANRKPAALTALTHSQPASLTPEDAHNLIVLLNRVSTTGVQEAMLLAILAQKLSGIKGTFTGAPSGENTPSSP